MRARLILATLLATSLAIPAQADAFRTAVETVGTGTILDTSPSRILFVNNGALGIKDRATGAVESVPATTPPAEYGFLSPHGAIFVAFDIENGSVLDARVKEWRDGQLIDHGFPNSTTSLLVEGDYAIWSGTQDGTCCATDLYRENLDTGATVTVATDAGNWKNDVTAAGDVYYWTRTPDADIFRYQDGTSERLTNDDAFWNVYVVTDGINAVYMKRTTSILDWTSAPTVLTPAGETVLDSPRNGDSNPYVDFDASGGWVAFTRIGPDGKSQVWRRDPAGNLSRISPNGVDAKVAAINPAGEVLFAAVNGAGIFLSRPGSPAVDLGGPAGPGNERGHGGYYFFEGGRWFWAAGNTLYELTTGYPRPKGATPSRLALVTAYEPCGTPNRVHGPPLSFGSCAPPQQSSAYLTPGTGDSNGKPAKSQSWVRMSVVTGNPATAADEADVKLDVYVNDVRRKSDLEDYTGEVLVRATLRITDRDTAGLGGGATHGTMQDIPLEVPVQCVATPDTGVGATCSVSTTYDTLAPAIREGRRSIWQLGAVKVFDGGADGDVETSADNTLFAVQGVFVP